MAEGNDGVALSVTEGITSDHFSIPEVARLFDSMMEEYDQGKPFDDLAMSRKLSNEDWKLMAECQIKAMDGTILDIPRHLNILQELYKKREIKKLAQRMLASADEKMVSANDLLSYSEGKLLEIGCVTSSDTIRTVGESLAEAAKNLEDRILGKVTPFIKTGFKGLDDRITGYVAKDYTCSLHVRAWVRPRLGG